MPDSQTFLGRSFTVGIFYDESDFFGFNELSCGFLDCRYFQHPENLHCLLLVKSHQSGLLLIDILRSNPRRRI